MDYRLNGNCCPPPYSAYSGVAEASVVYNSAYEPVGSGIASGARYSGVYATVDQTVPLVSVAGAFGSSSNVQSATDFINGAVGGECSVVSVSQSAPLPPPGYTSVIVDAQQYQLGLGADFTVH